MTPQQGQQLKARFFGMHIGCGVKSFDVVETNGINVGVDKRLNGVYSCLIQYNAKLIVGELLPHCKLILRPLSSITDEEAIECAKIAALKHYDKVLRFKDRIDVENIQIAEWVVYIGLNQIGIWGEGGSALMDDIKAYDYLRSRNFCLPFQGIDPIDAGWAILEETQPNT